MLRGFLFISVLGTFVAANATIGKAVIESLSSRAGQGRSRRIALVQRGGSKWQMVILEAGPMMEIVVFRMR